MKLHDLQADLDARPGLLTRADRRTSSIATSPGPSCDQLDPILDACVTVYLNDLDEDGQVDFKGKAKAFARTYALPVVRPALLRTPRGRSARSS